MFVISKKKLIFILLVSVTLVGCTAPYETVNFKPYPENSEVVEPIIGPENPDLHEALMIIDTVLVQNNYSCNWTKNVDSARGWRYEKTYDHHHPSVFVTVSSEGVKKPTQSLKAGKSSIEITVFFEENMRFFLKARPEVTQVRNEIAEQLSKRFGQDKVTKIDGRENIPLQ